jgi:hypothetical protein
LPIPQWRRLLKRRENGGYANAAADSQKVSPGQTGSLHDYLQRRNSKWSETLYATQTVEFEIIGEAKLPSWNRRGSPNEVRAGW